MHIAALQTIARVSSSTLVRICKCMCAVVCSINLFSKSQITNKTKNQYSTEKKDTTHTHNVWIFGFERLKNKTKKNSRQTKANIVVEKKTIQFSVDVSHKRYDCTIRADCIDWIYSNVYGQLCFVFELTMDAMHTTHMKLTRRTARRLRQRYTM